MPRLFLVRHAKPSAGWDEHPDPGIDATGIEQSRTTASELAVNLAPAVILSSPMRRCRETAQPLEQMWQQSAKVLTPVAEIPAPPLAVAARRDWLNRGMRGTWQELQADSPPGSPDYLAWREALLDSLMALEHDSVIFTHFIAINAAVAAARRSPNVVCFRPDHASVTVVETSGRDFKVMVLGREAETGVLMR
ncbi:phosphoglycerate mutase family protein [Povalibacter sp.]|uniref:histidine phosphatase family protein n=1 Tax=Povalibacter sp. TaxID=1962978 RepID=UPI002F425CA5